MFVKYRVGHRYLVLVPYCEPFQNLLVNTDSCSLTKNCVRGTIDSTVKILYHFIGIDYHHYH